MVSIPRRLASSKPRSRFSEFPLVDSPTAMSLLPPNAAICRANTTLTPTSLHSAVTTDVSLDRQKAGAAAPRARVEEQRGQLLCVGGAAAVAEGEQPPAGREPRPRGPAHRQPGRVPAQTVRRSSTISAALATVDARTCSRTAGRSTGAGVQERVQRPPSPRWRPLFPAQSRSGHFPTIAMASLACTRILSPTWAGTSATLTSSSPCRCPPRPDRRRAGAPPSPGRRCRSR